MPCPYRAYVNNNDGSACCKLSGGNVDEDTQKEYCISHHGAYERCPQFESAEILTESVCEEIRRSFSDAVDQAALALAEIDRLVTEAVRFGYLPLADACACLQYPPQIPRVRGDYQSLVRTEEEKALASRLDEDLDRMLDSLRYSIGGIQCSGAHPAISTDEINSLAWTAERCGGYVVAPLGSYQVSVKPEKYAEPAQSLASESAEALLRRMSELIGGFYEAGRILEDGIRASVAAADSDVWPVLHDARIGWEVD